MFEVRRLGWVVPALVIFALFTTCLFATCDPDKHSYLNAPKLDGNGNGICVQNWVHGGTVAHAHCGQLDNPPQKATTNIHVQRNSTVLTPEVSWCTQLEKKPSLIASIKLSQKVVDEVNQSEDVIVQKCQCRRKQLWACDFTTTMTAHCSECGDNEEWGEAAQRWSVDFLTYPSCNLAGCHE
jgi:hypothetical protein